MLNIILKKTEARVRQCSPLAGHEGNEPGGNFPPDRGGGDWGVIRSWGVTRSELPAADQHYDKTDHDP